MVHHQASVSPNFLLISCAAFSLVSSVKKREVLSFSLFLFFHLHFLFKSSTTSEGSSYAHASCGANRRVPVPQLHVGGISINKQIKGGTGTSNGVDETALDRELIRHIAAA